MNFIDLIIVIVVIIFCIKGYLKGFIHELFSLLIIIFGFTGAFLFYRALGEIVGEFITNIDLAVVVSFFLIFFFITIVLILVRNVITQFVDRLNLADVDYVLGTVLGMIKGLLLCGLILIFVVNHPVLKLDEVIQRSVIFPFLERMIIYLLYLLPGRPGAFLNRILGIS